MHYYVQSCDKRFSIPVLQHQQLEVRKVDDATNTTHHNGFCDSWEIETMSTSGRPLKTFPKVPDLSNMGEKSLHGALRKSL